MGEQPVAALRQPTIPVPPADRQAADTVHKPMAPAGSDRIAGVNSIWSRLFRVCPQCGSTDVHSSLRHTFIEHYLLVLLLVQPYRCHFCNWRFRAFRWAMRVPQAQAGSTEYR